MSDFKVGNRVKLVKYDDLRQIGLGEYFNKNGTVIEVNTDFIRVKFDNVKEERSFYKRRFVKLTKLDKILD